jgi:hypothetical protein
MRNTINNHHKPLFDALNLKSPLKVVGDRVLEVNLLPHPLCTLSAILLQCSKNTEDEQIQVRASREAWFQPKNKVNLT